MTVKIVVAAMEYDLSHRRVFPRRWLVFAIAVSIRLVPAIFITGTEDVGLFNAIASAVQHGENPYSTVAITWPPLWATMVTLSKDISDFTGLSFSLFMKAWPILADGLLSLVLYAYACRQGDETKAFRLSMLWALNPLSIYITSFHGQFDSIPALCVLLAVIAQRDRESVSDYTAAWWLGIGGLAKTWPLFVVPAFLQGTWREKARFAVISALPTATTMSILFALDPASVLNKVIRYRGAPGWWGTTGIADLLGQAGSTTAAASAAFYLAWAATSALYLSDPDPAEGTLAILLSFLAFTPGFGPQYLIWFVPVAVLVDRRRATLYSAIAAAVVFAEGFMRPHNGVFGDYLRYIPGPLFHHSYAGYRDRMITVVGRLPVWAFALYWWATIVGARGLRRMKHPRRADVEADSSIVM